MVPDLDHKATVPALLAQAVERFGNREYIVSATERLTFREADERSALLARRLVDAGAGKGTRIGIVLPSGVDFTLAFLAATRIGSVAMLFSSTYKPAELARVVRIADVHTLFAPRVLLGRDYLRALEASFEGLADHGPGPLRLTSAPYLRSIWLLGDATAADPPWATPAGLFDTPTPSVDTALLAAIENEVTPADLLLSICTSGSSADPKVVVHTHGVAVRKVHPETGLGLPSSIPDERVLVVMPFFWVGGPQCLLGALHSGSPIICQERLDPEAAVDLIERERVTIVTGWPAVVEAVKTHPSGTGRDLSSLKPFASSMTKSTRGDPVNVGMSETFGPHHNPEFFDYKVIDPDTGDRLADGEIGEFCVRGRGLMAGIYKREREENFDGDGWYHTGDRGYIEAGRIYFRGRYSEMLKCGGANVAPAEVEQALLTFPDVAEAYVVGIAHPELGDEVAAVVVPVEGSSLDAADLRTRAKEILSAYKVPGRFAVVDTDRVPRLATGKPDKRSIAATLFDSCN